MEDAVNILGMFWPFLILIAIFYFFMYRPQKKLQLERGRFLLSLRKGDHVVTSGGVHGIIKVLRDKYVELEIAPKVIIKVEKTAIHHGDVDLIDTETAKKAGAAVIGAEAENPEDQSRLHFPLLHQADELLSLPYQSPLLHYLIYKLQSILLLLHMEGNIHTM